MDIAILGSSPIMLINAVKLSKLGHNVTIYDKDSNLGGSWASGRIGPFENIDLGVHLLYYQDGFDKEINYFNDEYDLGLVLVTPSPTGDIFNFLRNYPEFSFKQKRLNRIYCSLSNLIRRYNNFLSRKYFYFYGGCNGLIARLRFILEYNNVIFRLSEKVERISQVSDDEFKIDSLVSSKIYNRVICSSRCLDTLLIDDTLIDSQFFQNSSLTQIFLSVIDPCPINFFMHKFCHDKIFAVSNCLKFSNNSYRGSKKSILAVALHRNVDIDLIDINYIFHEIKKRNILSNNATLEKYEIRSSKSVNIDLDLINILNSSYNGKLHVIRYDNFSRELLKFRHEPHYLKII